MSPVRTVLPRTLCVVLVVMASVRAQSAPRSSQKSAPARFSADVRGFVPNGGQWARPALFRAKTGSLFTFVLAKGWRFLATTPAKTADDHLGNEPRPGTVKAGVCVDFRFVDADDHALQTQEPLEGNISYFIGDDPSRWAAGLTASTRVSHESPWPGVDVELSVPKGVFTYQVHVRDRSSLERVMFAVSGHDRLEVDEDGRLRIHTPLGCLTHSAPVAWHDVPSRIPVPCRFVLLAPDRVAFSVETARDLPLIIDPGVTWTSLPGGSADEQTRDVSVSASGDILAAGRTDSVNFPTSLGVVQSGLLGASTTDAWVGRWFADTGGLRFLTYLGSSGFDGAFGVSDGPAGTVALVGYANGPDLPLVAPLSTQFGGTGPASWGDGFIAVVSGFGTALTFSTYLGGAGDERLDAVERRGSELVVAGFTTSLNLGAATAVTPSFATSSHGGSDALVARIDPLAPAGSGLLTAWFLGGSNADAATSLAIQPSGTVLIAGLTGSTNFPVTSSAWSSSLSGGLDAFLVRLDPTQTGLAQLLYGTFLGGNGDDIANGVASGPNGAAVLGGQTTSSNFPTSPSAWIPVWSGGVDGFLARLNPAQPVASQLSVSTYLGGGSDDFVNDVATLPSGAIVGVGATGSQFFPTTTGAPLPTFLGGPTLNPFDGFLCHLAEDGTSMVLSTIVGGATHRDFAFGVAVLSDGSAIVGGLTRSTDFPSAPATVAGQDDAFILRDDLLPRGVARFGIESPAGCPVIVSVSSWPRIGNPGFAVTSHGAPPGALGFGALSDASLTAPLTISTGLFLWIDPARPAFWPWPVVADGLGRGQLSLPIPLVPSLIGATIYAQFAWLSPCQGVPAALTHGLAVTIQ